MKCPQCGSENVQFSTNTTGRLFSGADACCGFLLLGPLGLLCGACNSGIHTDEFWICHDCGNRFSNNKAQKHMQEIQAIKESKIQARKKYLSYKQQLAELSNTEDYSDLINLHNQNIQIADTAYAQYQKYREETLDRQLDESKYIRRYKNIIEDFNPIMWIIIAIAGFAICLASDSLLGVLPIIVSIIAFVQYRRAIIKLEMHLCGNDPKLVKLLDIKIEADENKTKTSNIMNQIVYVQKYEQEHLDSE